MTKCLVGACDEDGVVHLELDHVGGHNEGWFCEPHAKVFEPVWTRVEPEPEQLDLFGPPT